MAGSCSPVNPCVTFAAALAVCRVDFDQSGVVDSADVVAFVNAWFAQEDRTDFDGSGRVDALDIFAYLTAWFAGCS